MKWTFLLYDYHIFPHETLLVMAPLPWGEHIVNMVPRRSVYTVSAPRRANIVELFFGSSWHHSSGNVPFLKNETSGYIQLGPTCMALLASLLTVIILSSRASYSASLFVAGKPNLKDFSMVIFSKDTRSIPTPDPF